MVVYVLMDGATSECGTGLVRVYVGRVCRTMCRGDYCDERKGRWIYRGEGCGGQGGLVECAGNCCGRAGVGVVGDWSDVSR